MTPSYWRKCSSCKSLIPFQALYWVCNVSTCNRKRTGLVFCKVSCWDAHVPMMNHRDAWAEERKAPTEAQWKAEQTQNQVTNLPIKDQDEEILVVASKIKEYIEKRSGMSTSASVMEILSRKLRAYANDAIRRAGTDGRKTVLDRDFRF